MAFSPFFLHMALWATIWNVAHGDRPSMLESSDNEAALSGTQERKGQARKLLTSRFEENMDSDMSGYTTIRAVDLLDFSNLEYLHADDEHSLEHARLVKARPQDMERTQADNVEVLDASGRLRHVAAHNVSASEEETTLAESRPLLSPRKKTRAIVPCDPPRIRDDGQREYKMCKGVNDKKQTDLINYPESPFRGGKGKCCRASVMFYAKEDCDFRKIFFLTDATFGYGLQVRYLGVAGKPGHRFAQWALTPMLIGEGLISGLQDWIKSTELLIIQRAGEYNKRVSYLPLRYATRFWATYNYNSASIQFMGSSDNEDILR